MRLIHVSDIHIGATSEAILDAAHQAIKAHPGAALVVSGDLTQRGSREEFRRARDWVDAVNLPTIVVPGNHDTPLLHPGHRVFKPFERYADYFGDLTRPLKAGAAHLLPLNTARGWQSRANWAEGSVALDQLNEMIARTEDYDTVHIMVCHHPFTPFSGAGLNTRTRRGEVASERLAGSAVRLLMTGHVHTPHMERIQAASGEYIALSAGTLSLRLRSSPPGFNIVDIDATGMNIAPYVFGHETFEPLPAARLEWSEPQQPGPGAD
jgi:3',5'-cyclic AMP phosphodiesterase CpdA